MSRLVSALAAACGLAFAAASAAPSAALAQSPDSPVIAARHGRPQHLPAEKVTVLTARGPAAFTMQMANDETAREVGLMFVRRMEPRQGMIFDFGEAGERAFWMHGTIIPLDILYVGADGRVLSIAKRAKPFDETPLPSRGPARVVLEINAGLSDKLGIAPGDRVCDVHAFHCPRP